ncbi:hypothetical protein HN709_01655 [Candidatus Peregrinibacteria bacterium]|jgi:hypothetical protein|nr:hypothetical protein [Candidatus Peregrinibacteria bacterium]MBT7736368.1 hypothetical protein [Candidatus Peregrinibacteria bacterium]
MNIEDNNLLIERYAKGKEDDLIDRFVCDGPSEIMEELGLSEEAWRVVFDYLVFEKNLLHKCVTRNGDFFVEEYVKYGISHIREILDIVNEKYDIAFESVFDFIVISNDALYLHVMEHRGRYTTALKARGADFVRKVLGVWRGKYSENWQKVLDLLLHAVCDAIFSETTYEHGLVAFSRIFNDVREHRPIYKSGILL